MGSKRGDVLDFENGANSAVPASKLHIDVAVIIGVITRWLVGICLLLELILCPYFRWGVIISTVGVCADGLCIILQRVRITKVWAVAGRVGVVTCEQAPLRVGASLDSRGMAIAGLRVQAITITKHLFLGFCGTRLVLDAGGPKPELVPTSSRL